MSSQAVPAPGASGTLIPSAGTPTSSAPVSNDPTQAARDAQQRRQQLAAQLLMRGLQQQQPALLNTQPVQTYRQPSQVMGGGQPISTSRSAY